MGTAPDRVLSSLILLGVELSRLRSPSRALNEKTSERMSQTEDKRDFGKPPKSRFFLRNAKK